MFGLLWLRNPIRHPPTDVPSTPVAGASVLLCQHVGMARGELFSDPVALGAIAAMVKAAPQSGGENSPGR
jgi:hypothetical protein